MPVVVYIAVILGLIWCITSIYYLMLLSDLAVKMDNSDDTAEKRPFIERLNYCIEEFGKESNDLGGFCYVMVLPAYIVFLVIYYLVVVPVIIIVSSVTGIMDQGIKDDFSVFISNEDRSVVFGRFLS